MPPALRRTQILERVRRDGGASVAALARELDVAPVTVHRDLALLAGEGLLERVHGGAQAIDAGVRDDGPLATAWEHRVRLAKAAKEQIAEHAVRSIGDGETVFLDSSSTALALARQLMRTPRNELTLVTNSTALAHEMASESTHVIVTPGELDQHMRMLAGRWTVEFLDSLNFETAFVSAAGVSVEHGLTTSRRPVADVINAARANARRTVALLDASKFGRASLLTIMATQDPDVIVTDGGLDPATLQAYRSAGVELEVAGPATGPA